MSITQHPSGYGLREPPSGNSEPMLRQQQISERAVSLQPSLTLAISARAKELQKEGRDICSLSAGEPDFDTPEFIVEAAIKALKDGITKYGPAAGDPELREAIARKLTNENRIDTKKEEVLVTNGGKQAIYNLCQILLNPGDEVLIPSPYWLSYPEIVKLAGARPIIITSNFHNNFKININLIESAINSKTKLIILNSPCNPSGCIISKSDYEDILELLKKHENINVISDEIYECLIDQDQVHYSFGSIAKEIKDRVFTINGFAKAWAMTGWRVGYLAGNQKVISATAALQSQSTSNVCSFAQKGALAAISGPRKYVEDMALSYSKRREQLIKGLSTIEGIGLVKPKGAFYAFPQLPEETRDSISFCKKALEEVGLALVPGAAFGDNSCIRVSCAVSPETIEQGLEKLSIIIKRQI